MESIKSLIGESLAWIHVRGKYKGVDGKKFYRTREIFIDFLFFFGYIYKIKLFSCQRSSAGRATDL
jgi:hypothetical protein